jgi:two-component system nitrogen regulation sensor histidine kinase NtrY
MSHDKVKWKMTGRILLLAAACVAACLTAMERQFLFTALCAAVFIYVAYDLVRSARKVQQELDDFVQSTRQRDFSRRYNVKDAPEEVKALREGFNEINNALLAINKEKETQYQYLQNILQVIDTGILSFEEESGRVVWMNESLRQMLALPYLKSMPSLQKRNPQLYSELQGLTAGSSKVVNVHTEKDSQKILLTATAFQTGGVKCKLVSFQNIHEALEETESKAWQKLLSVLTHEIMNSVAPISSLALTLQGILSNEEGRELSPADLQDVREGIETIQRRSQGLLKFAETYRSLYKINSLNLREVVIGELFTAIYRLMLPTFEQKGIRVEILLTDPGLSIHADPHFLEQVLINLVVNAIEALKDTAEPKLVFSAEQAGRKVLVRVSDNGQGMTADVLEQIFIPFFSTRKQGTGIGLSLCKQILLLHKATIQAQSQPGKGTAFTIQFGL